jgi:hypothetical protein
LALACNRCRSVRLAGKGAVGRQTAAAVGQQKARGPGPADLLGPAAPGEPPGKRRLADLVAFVKRLDMRSDALGRAEVPPIDARRLEVGGGAAENARSARWTAGYSAGPAASALAPLL